MNGEAEKFRYNLSQCYLEIARCAFTSIHTTDKKEKIQQTHSQEIANTIFGILSTSIIYSYLAIESFVNYQLYRVWEKRNSDFPEAKRFNTEFKNITEFIKLKDKKSICELGERIKTICRLLNYKQIHKTDKQLWQKFCELVSCARHFLVHPFPDPSKFNDIFKQIMEKNKAGLYVEVAEKIIKFLYNESNMQHPDWLQENKLLKSRGFILITNKNKLLTRQSS